MKEQVSVKIEDTQLDWLNGQVKAGRFATVSHGVRFALQELMEKEKHE